MYDHDDLVDVLSDAGFSTYQAEAYLGLLRLRDATVSELAEACSVPRSRLYEVLEELEKEGYVETVEGETLQAQVADVTPVVSELRDWSAELGTAAEEIEERWERPEFGYSNLAVFQTVSATVREVTNQIDESHHTVQLCGSPEQILEFREVLEAARDRDVTIRLSVVDDPAVSPPDGFTDLFPSLATEVRRCEATMPMVALVDGSFAAVGVDNESDGEYGLVIDDTTLTSILHWFFQLQLWEPWETLYSESIGPPTIYVSIRALIRDIESLQTDNETVSVRVEGIDTATHEMVEFSGDVTEVMYTDVYQGQELAFAQQFIQAALRIDAGDREVTVGGYGAVLEDIRAIQIEITDIT